MIVFVRIQMQKRLQILNIPSVLRFMHDSTTSSSAIIPDDQINRFRLVLEASEMPIQIGDLVAARDIVRVKTDPSMGLRVTI